MKRFLFPAGALAIVCATAATGQERPATQPQPAQPPAKAARGQFQPEPKSGTKSGTWGAPLTRMTPARLSTLEEEFELVEAQRDVRRAHVMAAEVGVRAAEITLERVSGIAKTGIVTREELEKAKLEVDAAKAQLQIKMAEMKEVEIKVKYAKQRLEDAKAAGIRPAPARPAGPPVDPPPVPRDRGRDRGER
jgi:hypothetical protein